MNRFTIFRRARARTLLFARCRIATAINVEHLYSQTPVPISVARLFLGVIIIKPFHAFVNTKYRKRLAKLFREFQSQRWNVFASGLTTKTTIARSIRRNMKMLDNFNRKKIWNQPNRYYIISIRRKYANLTLGWILELYIISHNLKFLANFIIL